MEDRQKGSEPPRRRQRDIPHLDTELADLPPEQRWREWMMRVEAVIFAASEPVPREQLARVVGRDCNLDHLLDDLREELKARPYDVVTVAGGWHHRTRRSYSAVIRASAVDTRTITELNAREAAVLMAIAYFQPVTRAELSRIFGKDISRDTIATLRHANFILSGPRSPTPGAPYTFVTSSHFLATFGFETLQDLPDVEALEDAGLLSRHPREEAQAEDGPEGGETEI